MSTAAGVAVLMAVVAGCLLAYVAVLSYLIRVTGSAPTAEQSAIIVIGLIAVAAVIMMLVWPGLPAEPVLIVPDGPPGDPLAGYDSSELP